MYLLTDHPDLSLFMPAEEKGYTVGRASILYFWNHLPPVDDPTHGAKYAEWLDGLADFHLGVIDREDEVFIEASHGKVWAASQLNYYTDLAAAKHRQVSYYASQTCQMQFQTQDGNVKTWNNADHAESFHESLQWSRGLPVINNCGLATPTTYRVYPASVNNDAVELARTNQTIRLSRMTGAEVYPFVCHHQGGFADARVLGVQEFADFMFKPALKLGCEGVIWFCGGMVYANVPTLAQDIKDRVAALPPVPESMRSLSRRPMRIKP